MSRMLQLLGNIYSRIPPERRPAVKRAATFALLRTQSATKRRRIYRGRRVEYLDFEIAHLEPYEFLGPGPGEVMVAARASCISPGTERAVLLGLPGARRGFPYTPGYSTAGVVLRAGRGVDGIKPGDLVAGRMSHASHGIMTVDSLFKVPPGVPAEQASFLELGIITLQGIRKAGIRPGERVAVVGQGLIGQLATRLAWLAGAGSVVAVASSRRRQRTATAGPGGADEFVALSDGTSRISAIEADVVIEAVGSSRAITLAMEATVRGGRVVLLGSSRDLGRGLDWWSIAQQRNLTLIGAHISAMPARDAAPGRWTYRQEGSLFLDLLAGGRLEISDLITWRPSPAECNQVYEILAEGGRDHVGIIFDWRNLAQQKASVTN
jgi:L-iditol 2-dehydrogenase